jgi:hypothetical protein
MTLIREQVLQHLYAISEQEPGWQESHAILLEAGKEVVPRLMEVIEAERQKAIEGILVRNNTRIQRLIALLAEYADPRSLRLIIGCYYQSNQKVIQSAFKQVLQALEQRAAPDDIRVLIELLEKSTHKWMGMALMVEFHHPEVIAIAETLVRIAERDPKPELHAVLPMLRYNPATPFVFLSLHKRLKVALTQKSLPIPASGSSHLDSALPIPAKSDTSIE